MKSGHINLLLCVAEIFNEARYPLSGTTSTDSHGKNLNSHSGPVCRSTCFQICRFDSSRVEFCYEFVTSFVGSFTQGTIMYTTSIGVQITLLTWCF